MRILISYFFGADAIPIGESCARALQELGHTVERFDSRIEHRLQSVYKPTRRLLRPVLGRQQDPARWFGHDNLAVRSHALRDAVRRFRPDLLLVLRGNHFEGDTLASLKHEFGLTTAAWWLYGPEEDHEVAADVRRYDHYFSMYPSPLPGITYLPALAVDRSMFHPQGPREPYEHAVAFVGRNSQRRNRILPPLSDLPLSIWGAGWRKPRDGWRPQLWRRVAGRGVWAETLRHTYRRSRIVLDVNVWEPGTSDAMNQRLFDVPCCGGFLLTEPGARLGDYFKPGVEIETWHSEAELRDKLTFYLREDQARERIAAAGLQRTFGLPSYTDRMRDLLKTIDA